MRFPWKTLAARLTALLLVAQVAMALIFGAASYLAIDQIFERSALSGLAALATVKQTALDEALEDYVQIVRADLLHPLSDDGVAALLDPETTEPALHRDLVRGELRRHSAGRKDLERVEVVDSAGRVVVSLDTSREGLQIDGDPALVKGLERASAVDMIFDHDEFFVRASGPIRDRDGAAIAALLVRFRAREILALVGDYTGLGESGESVLGRRRGDEIEFLVPLRFAPDVKNLPRAPVGGETARPMIHATAGQSGMIRARDYRGARVVAAYRPLTGTGWGLVVKQDEEEIFAGVRRLGQLIVLALCALIGLGVSLVVPIVRRFVRPIAELVEATHEVAGGRLDVSVPEGGGEELDSLARSFNHMVDRLGEARAELSQANEELSEQAAALRRTNEEIGAFTYMVSHDLRTPLVSIRGMRELLEKELGGELSQEAKTYLGHIDSSVLRMDRLIGDLLELSRVGRINTVPEWIESAEIVEHVVAEVAVLEGERRITVAVAPGLPRIFCNGRRFYQVMSNLVGNAVKYCAGVPDARVEVTCDVHRREEEEAEAVFYVRDNGPGIPSEDQERVFGLFQRLHGSDVPGTGMGLALVERIVTSLGGWIRLESVPGAGATFYFGIPAGTKDS